MQKFQIVSIVEIWYLDYFEYAEFNGGIPFFCFKQEIPVLRKFDPKNQNCPYKLKFGTESNSNMWNLMVMLSFSVLDWKNPFWANLTQKNQNYLHKLKFGTKYNSSMLNLMVMFIFAVLDQKCSFWVNLIKKKSNLFP